ncbi:MAG: hypothetical protein NC094_11080 [Bacteroidales bacterium]|nr:hypothetical protein [Bacteroidales bacterium]
MSDEQQLRQAKKRDKKVYITDIAIEKVPYVEYRGMDEEQNKNMQSLARLVLTLAKNENDSNEVAITWDMERGDIGKYGVAYGTEHDVNICSDTYSYHLLHSVGDVIIVVLHNHPSTKTFSLTDIYSLMKYRAIQYMVVVSNQGTIHYLKKEKNYDENKAGILYNECNKRSRESKNVEEMYEAVLGFLRRCHEVGLYYK